MVSPISRTRPLIFAAAPVRKPRWRACRRCRWRIGGCQTAGDIALWSRGLVRMAREAPELVVAVASRTDMILQACDGSGFESFIATGLKYTRGDRARRRAFFTLEDRLAAQVLEQAAGALTFSRNERILKAYATALWGRPPVLRSAVAPPGGQLARRVNIAGGVVRIPPVFRGVPKSALPQLFRACVAHATAHVALTRTRFPIGSLKPLQMALIGLVEDARVETLAMRSFPGLAPPVGAVSCRRAVGRDHGADAAWRGWRARCSIRITPTRTVSSSKGRALFAAELHRLDDVSLSRQIGGLLGNDLGQMRVQFNARTYVVEPVYRDDGLGLWDFGERAQPQDDVVELMVDAARIERRDQADNPDRRRDEAEPTQDAIGRARPRAPDERGPVLATYPEWDCDAATERPDWTTVRAAPVWPGDAGAIDAALDNIPAVRARIRRLVRGAKVGRHERLKRRSDGPELDLDAALDAAIALRADDLPDERVFRTMMRRKRDLAVTILVDVSESTRDRVAGVRRLGARSGAAGGRDARRSSWPRSTIRSRCVHSHLRDAKMSGCFVSRNLPSLTVRMSRRGWRILNRSCRPGWARRCVTPAPKSRRCAATAS